MKNQFLFLGGSTGKTVHESFDKIFSLSNKDNYEATNLSLDGAGNYFIAGSFFDYLNRIGKPSYVFFKFTGLNRIDLPFDKKVELKDYPYQSMWHENNDKVRTLEKTWVASGGYAGAWMTSSLLKKIFSYMYDLKDDNATNLQSFQQISSCLYTCEYLKIPHHWTFYYDICDPPSANSKKDGHVKTIPWFISTENMLEIAPLNYAYDIGKPPQDGNHYSKDLFEEYLKEKVIYNTIKNTLDKI